MGFDFKKRAFFVAVMGEDRVRRMEEELPALAKELEAHGVRFKQLFEDVVTFADDEAVRLFGVFMGIAGNIIHAPERTTPEKLALLKQAVSDLAARITGAGGDKTMAVPGRRYVDDLMPQQPAESKAAKALRETGQPGAAYAADVLDGRMIRG